MSTELYPQLPKEEIIRWENENKQKEQRWLINELIKPELDNVLETLIRCLEMITDSEEVVLPLSSTRSELAKGVLKRRSSEISKINLALSFQTLSKRRKLVLNTKEQSHVELEQLTSLIHLINDTITLVLVLKDVDVNDCDGFISQLSKILTNLTKCNVAMNKPSEQLLFPKHKLDLLELFKEDESNAKPLDHYQDRLSMDFFILNGEIAVEIKSLHVVTQEPWCVIDPTTGKSCVDKLRDDLKHHRIKISDILGNDSGENGNGGGGGHSGLLSQVFSLNKFSAHDYLTRCVTYDGKVVIEVEKAVIHCQDPSLLSIGAKLNGLEHLVSKMYSNLDLSMM